MMALSRIRPNNSYAINLFQDSATIAVNIDRRKPYIIRVDDTTRSEIPWQEGHNKMEEASCSKREAYHNDVITRGDSETVLIDESTDLLTDKWRIPTESELRQIRLMNIPTRGFCISADEERITAESYRCLYDPEEFETPEI